MPQPSGIACKHTELVPVFYYLIRSKVCRPERNTLSVVEQAPRWVTTLGLRDPAVPLIWRILHRSALADFWLRRLGLKSAGTNIRDSTLTLFCPWRPDVKVDVCRSGLLPLFLGSLQVLRFDGKSYFTSWQYAASRSLWIASLFAIPKQSDGTCKHKKWFFRSVGYRSIVYASRHLKRIRKSTWNLYKVDKVQTRKSKPEV